jgi:hypothetical protein
MIGPFTHHSHENCSQGACVVECLQVPQIQGASSISDPQEPWLWNRLVPESFTFLPLNFIETSLAR